MPLKSQSKSMQCAGQLLQEHRTVHKVAIDSLALNPNGLIATGGADRTIQLCSVPSQVSWSLSFVSHPYACTLAMCCGQRFVASGLQHVNDLCCAREAEAH